MASYVGQTDHHLPILTVGETLEFASNNMNKRFMAELRDNCPKSKEVGLDSRLRQRNKVSPPTEFMLQKFGIAHVVNTPIGNDLLRGVSGGERKRVTVAEMKVGPAIVNCEDEISTGLDSAVTIDIMKTNKNISSLMSKTTIISLLQPPPDALKAADEILLMANGHIIYHAPMEHVETYFELIGYKRPPNVSISDYCVDLCTADGAMYFTAGYKN